MILVESTDLSSWDKPEKVMSKILCRIQALGKSFYLLLRQSTYNTGYLLVHDPKKNHQGYPGDSVK
jgi:hypothetical protein